MRFDVLSLVDKLTPSVRREFLRAVADIRNSASMTRLIQAVERGDASMVARVLNLREDMLAPITEALRGAYVAGGQASLEALPRITDPATGAGAVFRFNGRNPRAEDWLRASSSRLVAELVDGQVELIQGVLSAGMARGANPRTVSLSLVGRINRSTGRREGGLIGLHSQFSQYVDNPLWHADPVRNPPGALQQLTSGDKNMMRGYLTRAARDRRYDSIVRRAIKDGKPVDAGTARKISGKYSDKLLRVRGNNIARTELLGSLHASQDEGLQQLVDGGMLRPDQISATWDASEDMDTRPSHSAMEGQQMAADGTFTTGAGYRLRYPGDRELGAPAEEVINCRCRKVVRIDHLKGLE